LKLRRSSLAALGVAALAVPAAAIAHPGHGHANGHGTSHNVQYVFKGTYDGGGLVTVNSGNRHVRNAELVGQVQFDLTNTKFSVADTNTDLVIDVNDVLTDDAVVVQARLPRQDPGSQPFAARHLVDQTNPGDDESADDDSGDAGDAG
jgi:hypothetical protein